MVRNLRDACPEEEKSRSSRENWRWCRPQPQIAENNFSPEVKLERAIARACVAAKRVDWANQVPVASGIVGPRSDRRRAIDLVHRVGTGHFEFIELKIASDTPLYAAIEIIGYGCAWLLARNTRTSSNALLEATNVDLIVLAPSQYYAPFDLHALAAVLRTELRQLGEQYGVHLEFRFEQLAGELTSFRLPDDERLLTLLDKRRDLHAG